jgi:murein L,D-transpeptidase YcbB/YkuD
MDVGDLRRIAGEGRDRVDAADPAGQARREVAAMHAYLRYGTDLATGILVPSRGNDQITVKPARPDAASLMAPLESGTVAEALTGLQPDDPDYARLVAEKARLEVLAQSASWGPVVPDGPTLHPGESSPRVADLRARLARLGYGVPDSELAGTAFDDALTQSVEQFQRDSGLNDDGVVGKMTLAAVNAPVETRLAQVLVNLERVRWTGRDPGARYLEVNIPDFRVTLWEAETPVWTSKVVVGKTHVTETPEFDGVVQTMVVNPTWHIPDSIAIRDYLPQLQQDPMVLKRQNIRLLTRGGTEIDPRLIDFTQYTPESFPFRIKQRPSDDNALGEVKFLFPNEHSVYMHDTPHPEYFARDVRAYSNGCIRLEKPVELAHIVLTGQVPDPEARYAELRASGKERGITLDRTIPVHIVYRTVTFDETGAARYRPDVYGRDAQVFEALEAAGVTLPAAQG